MASFRKIKRFQRRQNKRYLDFLLNSFRNELHKMKSYDDVKEENKAVEKIRQKYFERWEIYCNGCARRGQIVVPLPSSFNNRLLYRPNKLISFFRYVLKQLWPF